MCPGLSTVGEARSRRIPWLPALALVVGCSDDDSAENNNTQNDNNPPGLCGDGYLETGE
ncbi:MAG: hypothetical protein JW940_32085 [Polyangiaceae bacterium]|nr:hypothetical protein [Polyangiaceae bacterium]